MTGRRLALIVATDEYADPGLRQLRAPATDAEALAQVLADPELGQFEVDVLRNGTSSDIGERVETLLSSGKPDDLIVMHFSCHGLKDESGGLFLAASNTRPGLLASTAVDAAVVNRLMRRSRAQRVVLFLDCCYGGAFERGMIPRAGGVVDVVDQFQQRDQELSGGRGRVVITASNAMEFAFEGAELADNVSSKPSIFTGAVVEGLTTGRADRDQDGLVALGELYDYVFERVRQESPSQTPGKWEFGLQGELILAKNPQRIVIPAAVPGDLVELTRHPFPATRSGAVDVLAGMAEGPDLPLAAGARQVLASMVDDDSRAVAAAATAAIERTSLHLSAASIDLGTLRVGEAAPPVEVSIEGVPLAVASTVATSSPTVRVRRIDRTIRIDPETATAGAIDAVVTVAGQAGSAEIHVTGVVVPASSPAAAPAPPKDDQAVVQARGAEPAAGPAPLLATAPVSEDAIGDAVAPMVGADAPASRPADDPYRRDRSYVIGAAARGSLGALVGDLIGITWVYLTYQDSIGSGSAWASQHPPIVVADILLFGAILAIAEWFLPVIRVPVGPADHSPWYRRLGIAAIQGAVLNGSVGLANYYTFRGDPSLLPNPRGSDYLQFFLLTGAIGFVIVQPIIERVMSARRSKPAA